MICFIFKLCLSAHINWHIFMEILHSLAQRQNISATLMELTISLIVAGLITLEMIAMILR